MQSCLNLPITLATNYNDFVIVVGDLNEYDGQCSFGFHGVYRNYCFDSRNEERTRLLEFSSAKDLILANHSIAYGCGELSGQKMGSKWIL